MNSIESSVFFLPCKNLEETKLYYTEEMCIRDSSWGSLSSTL